MRNFLRNLFNHRTAADNFDFGTSAPEPVTLEGEVLATSDPDPFTDTEIPPLDEFREISAGEAAQHLGLRIVHFRPQPDSMGLGSSRCTTVVYRPRQDPNHTIEIATAVCSTRDAYDRRQGNEIALMRFISGQRVHLPPNQLPQTDYELLAGVFA